MFSQITKFDLAISLFFKLIWNKYSIFSIFVKGQSRGLSQKVPFLRIRWNDGTLLAYLLVFFRESIHKNRHFLCLLSHHSSLCTLFRQPLGNCSPRLSWDCRRAHNHSLERKVHLVNLKVNAVCPGLASRSLYWAQSKGTAMTEYL